MVTKSGDTLYYDNLSMGAAKNPQDDETIYLVFTDKDNEEVHCFPVGLTKLEQFFTLVRQTAAGQQIEVTSQMPRGGPHVA